MSSTNGDKVAEFEATIEVTHDKRKYTLTRHHPEVPAETEITGWVDLGKRGDGRWIGYAIKDDEGIWQFTPVTRLAANGNGGK